MRPEDKVLNFDRDVELIAKELTWIEDIEAAKAAVVTFCNGKTHS